MKTNHAVTIVGYGTDRVNYAKPVKYAPPSISFFLSHELSFFSHFKTLAGVFFCVLFPFVYVHISESESLHPSFLNPVDSHAYYVGFLYRTLHVCV
jgi:hypothetical protein